MKKDMFEELTRSVREGGRILRGEAKPARAFKVSEPDAAAVRGASHNRTSADERRQQNESRDERNRTRER